MDDNTIVNHLNAVVFIHTLSGYHAHGAGSYQKQRRLLEKALSEIQTLNVAVFPGSFFGRWIRNR